MSRSVSTWSYRPGEWVAIFGVATTLLLPDSEKQRAAQLWELVDGGAGFDATLDQVLAPGLSVLPAFVLIGTDEGPTKVIVRGAGVRATLTTDSESVELDGSTVTTWVERTLEGVTSLSVSVGGAGGDGPDYLIDGGLVRVARVDHPPHAAPGASEEAPAVVVSAPEVVPAPEDDGDVREVDAVPDIALAADSEGAATELFSIDEPSPLDDEADTSSVSHPAFDPMPEDGPTPDPSGMVWAPDAPSAPPMAPLTAPPPPPPFPGAVPAADHDGMTRAGVTGEDVGPTPPGIPGQPQPPSVTRPVATLVISNGESVEVDRVVLVGRAPEARRFTATEQPRLVTVPSPLHEISSTHVEVRPGSGADHGSAVVTDMGSTNGTVLVQPGLEPEELQPGIAVQLIPGAIINLGDGVTIQVMNP
ncbi:FHA domain-containing protein [Nocardioides sp.]|uniref:FHA domain-containing protein n=1 Tax=Nocardioides sp. TaxID=35761 RepID=UPI00286B3BD6|nr:FHA domain-containing protein [Nocardioides sp.]